VDTKIALSRVADEALQVDCDSLRELAVFILCARGGMTVYDLYPFICSSGPSFNIEGVLLRLMQGERKRGYRGANLLRWHNRRSCTHIERRKQVSLNEIKLTPKGRALWRDIQSFFSELTEAGLRMGLFRALIEALAVGMNSCRQLSLFMLCARHDDEYLQTILNADVDDERYILIRGRLRALMQGESNRPNSGMKLLIWGVTDPEKSLVTKTKPIRVSERGHYLLKSMLRHL